MLNSRTIVLFSILAGLLLVQSQSISELHARNASQDLREALKDQNSIERVFQRIYNDVYVIINLDPKSKLFSQQECQILQDTDTVQLDLKNLYYYLKLQNLQTKCKLQTPDKVLDQLRAVQSDENFANVYYSVNGILQFEPTEQIQDACKRLGQFFFTDGSGKTNIQNQESKDTSYFYSGLLLETIAQCREVYGESVSKLYQDAKSSVDSALSNLIELFPGQLGWLEYSNTIEAVAKMVYGIEVLLNQSDPVYQQYRSTYFYGLINFLRDQNSQILSAKQRNSLVELYKIIQNQPIFTLRRAPVVTTQTNTEILFRYQNFFGDQILQVNHNLNAILQLNGELISKISGAQVNEKSDEWNWVFEVPTSEIQKFGHYTLTVKAAQPIEAVIENTVLITTKINIPELEFQILEDKSNIPISFENKVKSGETLEKVLKATEHSQIHFRFQIEFDRQQTFAPNLVGLRMKHPRYNLANNIAFASFDESKGLYKAHLDLGDTDITLAYPEKYQLELIVSDSRLKDNLRWSFAKLDVTFTQARKELPPNDADFQPASIIQHTFPAPRPEIPTLFVLFFSALIILAFLFFVNSVFSMGVNLKQFTEAPDGQIWIILFILALVGILFILVVFWVQINLVQTLYTLMFTSIPFFLIGNKALGFIKNQNKKQN